jgi:hypothetical protein
MTIKIRHAHQQPWMNAKPDAFLRKGRDKLAPEPHPAAKRRRTNPRRKPDVACEVRERFPEFRQGGFREIAVSQCRIKTGEVIGRERPYGVIRAVTWIGRVLEPSVDAPEQA